MENNFEHQVEIWLTQALPQLQSFSLKIIGGSSENDGYVGDVTFIEVTENNGRKYDFALKCSKPGATKSSLIRAAFEREIYLYSKVFPLFKQFEIDRGVKEPFDSVPQYFGSYEDNGINVIVLENLKKSDFHMWDSKKPLTRERVNVVIQKYAHFHALSVATKEYKPKEYAEIVNTLSYEIYREAINTYDFITLYESNVDDIADLFKNVLDAKDLERWLNWKRKIRHVCLDMVPYNDELKVVVHGDCWNNNFMYKCQDEQECKISKVAILDWQISRISSPIVDLSYFLFSCISGEDIDDLENILENYYKKLHAHLTELGSTFIRTYSFEKFLDEWKKYCRYGIVMFFMPLQATYFTKNDADSANSVVTFRFNANEKSEYKKRVLPILKYVLKNNLI